MNSIEIFHVLHDWSYFIYFCFLSEFAQLQILSVFFKKAFDSVLVVNMRYLYGLSLEIGRHTSNKFKFCSLSFLRFWTDWSQLIVTLSVWILENRISRRCWRSWRVKLYKNRMVAISLEFHNVFLFLLYIRAVYIVMSWRFLELCQIFQKRNINQLKILLNTCTRDLSST